MSIFDIDETQLLPIGEAILGTPIRHCHIEGSVPIDRGGCGDKALGDLVMTTDDGQESRIPLFIKKFSWKGRSEAVHYRQLAQCAVPTPRLYGALLHPDGDEILFMERLTEIGYDRHSEAEWRQLLSLLARFNACTITPDYASHLHAFEQGGRIGGWWITGFIPFPPLREEIEGNLRGCGVSESELPALSQAALQLCERVDALQKGLVHQDFLADNLGWRGERAELVVFDIHKNTLGPRFSDVAPFLGLPDWSNTAPFMDQSSTFRETLIRHYLHEYALAGGEAVSLATFYAEATLLFWAHKVAILWWMAEQQDTERIEQALDYLRGWTA